MTVGRLGEQFAADLLREKGYEIVGMNVYAGHGETDIVARKGEVLVFAEVKTRHAVKGHTKVYGAPKDAVDRRKQENLVRTAEEFLRQHPEFSECYPRIDVIEVYLDSSHRPSHTEHYENAVRKRNLRQNNKNIQY